MPSVASLLVMTDADTRASCLQDSLWREHSARLVGFATFLVGPHDANDIVVEAFLRALPKLAAGDVTDPGRYLLRAVTNQAHDLRRGRSRRWRRDLQAIGPIQVHDIDDFGHVRRAVADLTLSQRTVVYLAYWEGRTERHIAGLLEVSPSTVRQHLIRARAHLRRALE
jgi:RNA polymerase sigma-70 factor (ECF subfamily)